MPVSFVEVENIGKVWAKIIIVTFKARLSEKDKFWGKYIMLKAIQTNYSLMYSMLQARKLETKHMYTNTDMLTPCFYPVKLLFLYTCICVYFEDLVLVQNNTYIFRTRNRNGTPNRNGHAEVRWLSAMVTLWR